MELAYTGKEIPSKYHHDPTLRNYKDSTVAMIYAAVSTIPP